MDYEGCKEMMQGLTLKAELELARLVQWMNKHAFTTLTLRPDGATVVIRTSAGPKEEGDLRSRLEKLLEYWEKTAAYFGRRSEELANAGNYGGQVSFASHAKAHRDCIKQLREVIERDALQAMALGVGSLERNS